MTSLVRRRPGRGRPRWSRSGGVRRDEAVVEGGGMDEDASVSQNIYINPGSSPSCNGLANSISRRDVVLGLRVFGISDRSFEVCDGASRDKVGRLFECRGCDTFVGSIFCCIDTIRREWLELDTFAT